MGSAIFGVVFGLVLLIAGAELLVRGASKLAALLGLSQVVIGLTVVAFGTSAPELAVSIQAALKGTPDITMGTNVGSNIFNILFILGISATIVPLTVAYRMIRFDIPLMIGSSVLLYVMALNGSLARWEAGLLFALVITWTVWLIVQSRKDNAPAELADTSAPSGRSLKGMLLAILGVVVGLAALIYGGDTLVDNSVTIAKAIGLSERVIGLTLIAMGTSLPELATSIVAATKGNRDLAVANIVGSNMFNILAVIAVAGVVSPHGIPVEKSMLHLDFPVMLAASILLLPIAFTGRRINRIEGLLFLGYFSFYMVVLFTLGKIDTLETDTLTTVALVAGIATVVGLGISVVRAIREK